MKVWFILLPVVTICAEQEADLFSFSISETAADELILTDGFDEEGLTLFLESFEEDDQVLLPWSNEEFIAEDVTSFVERKARQMAREQSDQFVYENSLAGDEANYQPSHESLPKQQPHFLVRKPRVVPAKPSAEEEKNAVVQHSAD